MKDYLFRHKTFFLIFIEVLQTMGLSVYFIVFGSFLTQENSLVDSIRLCGYYNFILLFVVVFLCFRMIIGSKNQENETSKKSNIINKILKSACNSLIFPKNNKLSIRACLTICNYKTNKRVTVYSYNLETDPERTAVVDIDFGITGDAIKNKCVKAGALEPDHIKDYAPDNAKYISPDIRCVLAAPIFSSTNPDHVIGVLAFDSFNTINEVKFDTQQSKVIAQMWADLISLLL